MIIEKVALSFFLDINYILVTFIRLEFAKITDPETSKVKGEIKENFTIENIVNTIEWPENIKKD